MRFTVTWVPSAKGHLATLWVQGPDRQAIADSANRIDRELRDDAHTKGAPHGAHRAFRDDPLAVLYTVDPDDRMVRIIQVRRTR